MSMMKKHDVFISYRSSDRDCADNFRTVLEANGLRCWIDQEGIALASQWQPGSRADLTLAALTPPRAPAEEKSDEGTTEADTPDHSDDEALTTAPADKGARISAVGGFANQWRIIMSAGTDFKQQAAHPVGRLPMD